MVEAPLRAIRNLARATERAALIFDGAEGVAGWPAFVVRVVEDGIAAHAGQVWVLALSGFRQIWILEGPTGKLGAVRVDTLQPKVDMMGLGSPTTPRCARRLTKKLSFVDPHASSPRGDIARRQVLIAHLKTIGPTYQHARLVSPNDGSYLSRHDIADRST